ncbi:MAG: lysostaphin resistance A-like protein, partial [Candidatus Thorarchaeota archaeon]
TYQIGQAIPFLLVVVGAYARWGASEVKFPATPSRVLIVTIIWYFLWILFQPEGLLQFTPDIVDDLVFYLVLVGVPVLLIWALGEKVDTNMMGFGRPKSFPTALFIIVGFIVYGTVLGVILLTYDFSSFGLEDGTDLLVSSTLFPAIAEEIVVRGLIQGQIIVNTKDKLSGVVLSSLIFGLGHIIANSYALEGDLMAGLLSSFFVQFISGIVYGGMMLVSGSILPSSILHYLHNSVAWFSRLSLSELAYQTDSLSYILALAFSVIVFVVLLRDNKNNGSEPDESADVY